MLLILLGKALGIFSDKDEKVQFTTVPVVSNMVSSEAQKYLENHKFTVVIGRCFNSLQSADMITNGFNLFIKTFTHSKPTFLLYFLRLSNNLDNKDNKLSLL